MTGEVNEVQNNIIDITKHKAIQTPSREILKDELDWMD